MKKVRFFLCSTLVMILVFSLCVLPAFAAAPAWPENINIEAEGGILMDAGSGAVLYGKNIHERYFPASITKILTALIIIDKCNLDDTITFSHNAVYNVEKGSTNAGYDVGDKITVRQALYVLLLKSANEVANALAEHCAGSMDQFAVMMNEKAKELGCLGSHFTNPSGLNDENHYTTPYDFALICKAAYENPTFVEFDSTTYYELPANSKNPEPFTVYCGHKMLKKNSSLYYPGIIGGKTGYTTLAGNTLVTCAERDGMKLIAVILNGHQTHYTDTKSLLDYGFGNFKISDYDTTYTSVQDDLNLTGNSDIVFKIDDTRSVTLPKDAALSDATSKISYDLNEQDPRGAIAKISYNYGDRSIGTTWLLSQDPAVGKNREELSSATPSQANPPDSAEKNAPPASTVPTHHFPTVLKIVLTVVIAAALLFGLYRLLKYLIAKKENRELSLAREKRRRKRLESGFTDDILKDSSASINTYLKDTRTRKKKLFGRFKHKSRT